MEPAPCAATEFLGLSGLLDLDCIPCASRLVEQQREEKSSENTRQCKRKKKVK